jgi:hypothetical protein
VDNDAFTWAELILAAVLERRDAQPLIDLAMRAGIDLDALYCLVNVTLDAVRDHLLSAAGIAGWLARPEIGDEEQLLSVDDLAVLKNLGIAAE